MTLFTDAHTHHYYNDSNTINVLNAGMRLPDLGSWLSVGIHPWDISDDISAPDTQLIQNLLDTDSRIIAIGECGLDALHASAAIGLQMSIFEAQLYIAIKNSLPVIVHCVKAYPQLLVLLKKLNFQLPIVLHSPRVDKLQLSLLSNFDVYYSIGPLSINWQNGKEMIRQIPTDRLLCESDDSDWLISTTFERIADIIPYDRSTIQNKVYSNFMKVYNPDGKRKMV